MDSNLLGGCLDLDWDSITYVLDDFAKAHNLGVERWVLLEYEFQYVVVVHFEDDRQVAFNLAHLKQLAGSTQHFPLDALNVGVDELHHVLVDRDELRVRRVDVVGCLDDSRHHVA